MALETPQYEVTSKHDGFEVRCYSEMIIATTSVRSDYRGSTSSGFRRIANYIFGGNDKEMKILGMRAAGEHASSAIQAVALLMKMDKGIEELAELVHPHPSIIEGIQECVRMLLNKSVFKSSVFKDKLKCYSCVDGIITPLQRL